MRSLKGVRRVSPGVALALLHALRATDTPDEVIEDESFRISLPRRLGLNDVVDVQMRRFDGMRARGEALSGDEYANLLRLIGRRPDAGAVFVTTGTRLAEERFPPPGRIRTTTRRFVPRGLARRGLVRAMGRIAAALSPGATIRLKPGETAIEVAGGPLPGPDGQGPACDLLTVALEVCARRTADERAEVGHPACEARGDGCCRWVATVPGA